MFLYFHLNTLFKNILSNLGKFSFLHGDGTAEEKGRSLAVYDDTTNNFAIEEVFKNPGSPPSYYSNDKIEGM